MNLHNEGQEEADPETALPKCRSEVLEGEWKIIVLVIAIYTTLVALKLYLKG